MSNENELSYLAATVAALQKRIAELAAASGAVNFVELNDVPGNYVGAGGLAVYVKGAEDGLEFAAGGGGGAPTDAKYIVQEVNDDLSAEQSLGALTTGILKNTVAAGVGVLSIAVGSDLPAHDHDAAYISIIGAPAANHFPYQTAGGELIDSGYNAADFAAAGHGHALDDLADVDAPAPDDQDVLTWDDAAGKWIAQAPPAYEASTVRARAYLGTNQLNITSSTWVKVLLDTESYDSGGNFGSYKFTAPVSGYYLITAAVTFVDSSCVADKSYYIGIFVGGVVAVQNMAQLSAIGASMNVHATDCLYLASGQYVELYVFSNVAGNSLDILAGSIATHMAIHLLSTA